MRTARIEREPAPRKGDGKTRYTIDDAHKVFKQYFGTDYDMDTADATLAVAATNKIAGDPPWLMVISGSGNEIGRAHV